MKLRMHWVSAALVTALLAACGGGGDDINNVKVVGDSLADSGTFGLKFTVQGSALTGAGSTPIWPELIAADYGATLCPRYQYTGATGFKDNPGCGNYAVGGGLINNPAAPNSPISIQRQLQDLGAAGLSKRDLVLIDGGGNDIAALISAYLAGATDGGAAYAGILGTLLDATQVQTLLSQGATGQAQAGGAYMQAMAQQFASTITRQVLDKGGKHVAVLNIPDVTLTPKFGFVLGAIEQAQGAEAAAQLKALFGRWVQVFNDTLATQFKDDKRVAVVDFNGALKDYAAHPSQYQLSNVTTPACPIVGQDASTGLPEYDFRTCSRGALSAMTPPAGATGGVDWWKGYMFSDAFHPTPRGHQLMADMVRKAL